MNDDSFRTHMHFHDEEETAEFIKDALSNNLPVAMLITKNVDLTWLDVEGRKQNGDFHWMTITKYFKNYSANNTVENRYVAVSTWGERVSLNFYSCLNFIIDALQFVSVGW